MKNIFSKTAFSLMELIVASMLVSIVIFGIFSITNVLNSNNMDYGQKYLVKSQTQTTMNHMLYNANLAIGTASSGDEAILIGSAVGGTGAAPGNGTGTNANTFCIHQPGTGTTGGQNGGNWGTDIWLCYEWNSSTYKINWCAESYNSGANPRNAMSCSTSSSIVRGPIFLGTAKSVAVTFTTTGGQYIFSNTIISCLNNSLATCQASGVSSDPTANPEVKLSASVIPLQASGS